jgi:hypothetical protein
MTAKKRAKPKAEKPLPELEAEPDAWERFERAVDHVMKAPPKHRTAKNPTKRDGD